VTWVYGERLAFTIVQTSKLQLLERIERGVSLVLNERIKETSVELFFMTVTEFHNSFVEKTDFHTSFDDRVRLSHFLMKEADFHTSFDEGHLLSHLH
jgi:hypothetical protein